MSSSSAARVLDPLAAPEVTFPNAGVSVAKDARSDRIAPDVTAIGGAEAVAIVRAGGFIAAIESVASELAEGMVVEQEPAAGERLEREGVITLRLAAPPLDPLRLATENEGGLACEQAAGTAGPDDTEEWFQALAPGRRDTRAAARSGKRRRKYHRPTPPARERFFDPLPAPSMTPREGSRAVRFWQRKRERASLWPHLAASVFAFAPSLAGLQWRRASALLAGALLLVLLGMRLFSSSDRHTQSTHARAVARTTGAYSPTRRPASTGRRFSRLVIRPSQKPRVRRLRTREGAWAREQTAEPVAVVAAPPAARTQAVAPPAAPAPSAAGQFAYLGR
jgi:hypothetical protein